MSKKLVLLPVALIVAVGCNKQDGSKISTLESSTDSYDSVAYDSSAMDLSATPQQTWSATPAQGSPTMASTMGTYAQEDSFGSRVHLVQRKDTLYGLARQYYSDASQWRKIYEANRERISDPNVINVGMKLIIP